MDEEEYPKTIAGTLPPGFFIGGYTLRDGHGGTDKVWIDGPRGDGGDFSAKALEVLIADFYKKHF